MAYKALMLSGVPNFAFTIGYTNASWTLKADLVADVRRAGCSPTWTRTATAASVAPVADPTVGEERPFMDFSVRLRAARARPAAQAGRPGAVAAAAELPARPPHDPPRRRSTTACSAFG